MSTFVPQFPTPHHAKATEKVVDFFRGRPCIASVLLIGSTVRGKATPDSCLDFVVMVFPDTPAEQRRALQRSWERFYGEDETFRELHAVGRYSHVDLDFHDGNFTPGYHGWTSGPDDFELEIGNLLVYSVPLWSSGDYLEKLKRKWLPYYDEDLRQKRLSEVRRYCLNNLEHIPLYVDRGLYFQSFHRLYNAFREFLQALFIAHRTYPLSYDKWIREQVAEILQMPALYTELPRIFEIGEFESEELVQKAQSVKSLLGEHTSGQGTGQLPAP